MTPLAFALALSAASWGYLVLLRDGWWLAGPRLGAPDAQTFSGRGSAADSFSLESLDTGADARPDDPAATESGKRWPSVVTVIPARDEADVIERALASHLAQRYPGPVRIVVVDDASADGTGDVAERAGGGRVAVIRIQGPPPGWTGQVAALQRGFERAGRAAPDYLWFTDADVTHHPDTLRALVLRAERHDRHLVSTMVRLRADGFWEGLLVPAFVYFFQQLYPFRRVNRVSGSVVRRAAAAGGSMLVRYESLADAGGFEPIRSEVIDDCALARIIAARGPVWLGHAPLSRSLRGYGFAGVWRMVARTAFTQLRYSWPLLAATVVGMAVLYVVPVAAVASGLVGLSGVAGAALYGGALRAAGIGAVELAVAGAATWLLMAATFVPTLRLYGRPVGTALLLPLAGVLFTAMTVDSAVRYALGIGGRWKGRAQAHVGAGPHRTRAHRPPGD